MPTSAPTESPSLQPTSSPTDDFVRPGTFCEGGPDSILLDNDASKSWECSGTPNGQLKIIWQTTGVSSEGFGDDEYMVQLFQEDQEVYTSEEQVLIYQSSGNSGQDAVGIVGRGGYRVTYQCTLDFFLNDCEGGTFAFKVVDCGCPNGDDPILDCTIRNFEVARNAVCPPTPSPTRSPTVPDDDDDGGICFSGETTVIVENKGVVPISDVKVGDSVLVSENGRYDTVYTLMKANPVAEAIFTQIYINGTTTPLELTNHHLLMVNGQWKQASNVAVGDLLESVQGDSEITQIKTVRRKGFYAPFTFSGTIMASGVKASVFAGPESIHFNKTWNSGLELHSVLQWLLSYHRLVCRVNLDWCRRESHTEFGVSRMVEVPDMVFRWVQSQNGFMGLVLLVLLMTIALAANIIELLLSHWLALIVIGIFWNVKKLGRVRQTRSKP